MRHWEQIKKEERASESIVDGIPKGLPALIYEHKILRKAASIGLAAPGAVPADLPAGLADLDRATGRLRDASGAEGGVDGAATEAEPAAAVGEVLAATVAVALALGVDGESALHARSGRFLARFRAMEDPRRRRGRRPPRRRPGDRRRPVAPRRLWAPLLGSGARGRYLHADARPACSSRPDARRLGRRRFVARPGGNTPLVRLGRVGADLECDLIAKVEQFNPGGSVKDRPAIAMVDAAEREGLLEPGGTIVEPTSGNTGVGLALVAAQRGYRCIFVMSDKMSEEKVALLRAYGAEVVVCPTAVPPEHPDSYYSVADRLTRETPNAFRPDQYSNPHNPDEHERSTGPEIWRQTAGRITQSGRGGHGGTVPGGPSPQAMNPAVVVVAADRRLGLLGRTAVRTVRAGRGLLAHPYDRPDRRTVMVTDARASHADRRINPEGPPRGRVVRTAVHAALVVGRELGPEHVVVVLLPDSGRGYSRRSTTTLVDGFGFRQGEGRPRRLLAAKAGDARPVIVTPTAGPPQGAHARSRVSRWS